MLEVIELIWQELAFIFTLHLPHFKIMGYISCSVSSQWKLAGTNPVNTKAREGVEADGVAMSQFVTLFLSHLRSLVRTVNAESQPCCVVGFRRLHSVRRHLTFLFPCRCLQFQYPSTSRPPRCTQVVAHSHTE
jgi:hypothetical protein